LETERPQRSDGLRPEGSAWQKKGGHSAPESMWRKRRAWESALALHQVLLGPKPIVKSLTNIVHSNCRVSIAVKQGFATAAVGSTLGLAGHRSGRRLMCLLRARMHDAGHLHCGSGWAAARRVRAQHRRAISVRRGVTGSTLCLPRTSRMASDAVCRFRKSGFA
jgi:hypothetical protein